MKKFYFLILFLISINKSFAWHETNATNENVSVLGGLWVQIFVYEQHCQDNQYYQTVIERLPSSPRFNQYSSEIEHFSERQELAWERGGAGATAAIAAGSTDCDTMAKVIWEWFGEN